MPYTDIVILCQQFISKKSGDVAENNIDVGLPPKFVVFKVVSKNEPVRWFEITKFVREINADWHTDFPGCQRRQVGQVHFQPFNVPGKSAGCWIVRYN